MAYFGIEGWVALSVIAGAGILAMLNVLARQFAHSRSLHDLRVEATGLRRGYADRLAAMRARERGEVVASAEVVEEDEGMKFPAGGAEMRKAA